MRKSLILVLAILVCLCLSASAVLADKETAKAEKKEVSAAKAPVTATISAAAKKQPAVVFPHEKHTKLVKACDTCHHTSKGLTAESKVKVEKCSDCHMKVQGKMGTMADASMQKNPMHAKCIGCHKEQKKGPVLCAKCHVKK